MTAPVAVRDPTGHLRGVPDVWPAVSDPPVRTDNVVASAAAEERLDLRRLAVALDAEYDPEQFAGVVYRLDDPDCVALLFASGTVVWTGADSVAAVERAATRVFDDLRGLGVAVPPEPTPTVNNVVVSTDLGTELNLPAVALELGLERVEYDTASFPGLVYRLSAPETVAMLFASGRVVVTGADSRATATAAVRTVTERLTSLGLVG